MELQDRRALLAIALFAARADGRKDEREAEAIRGTLARIRGDGLEPELIWSEIESGWRKLDATVSELTAPETRALAYELAVCVCDADGATNEAERIFLAELAQALGVASTASQGFLRAADALAGAPLSAPAPAAGATALDERILRQAILCGALELLPQRLATLAIVPLQMRLVYQIGKQHGFELDR
jgi:tellurite resistance protein